MTQNDKQIFERNNASPSESKGLQLVRLRIVEKEEECGLLKVEKRLENELLEGGKVGLGASEKRAIAALVIGRLAKKRDLGIGRTGKRADLKGVGGFLRKEEDSS